MVRGGAQPENTYRLVVHICLFNFKGEMLIQQRQSFKHGWSNMWDLSVGGSAIAGETSHAAAERELREELGIAFSFQDVRPSFTIHFTEGFDDVYCIEMDADPAKLTLQYEEVQAVKWAGMEEILRMIDDGSFIPYHRSFIELLFFMHSHSGTHTRQDASPAAR